jgi:hypothetical protein
LVQSSREKKKSKKGGGVGWGVCVLGVKEKTNIRKKKKDRGQQEEQTVQGFFIPVVVVNVWNGDSTDKPKEKRIKFTRREIIPKILPLNFISRIIVSVRINYIRK